MFRLILHELLATTTGALAALFLDFEGETVELVCEHDLNDHELRILGAYQGIFLTRLRALTSQIAAGEPLGLDVAPPNGHAIECRIYAEDPITHIPSPGTIVELDVPEQETVRWDSGYRAGDEVTPYYDPLVGKLIVWGEDRASALARLAGALEEVTITGIKTNVGLLREVVANEGFAPTTNVEWSGILLELW